MLTVFGAFAELERGNTLDRQRKGVEIAKSEGRYKGRKPISINKEQLKTVYKRSRDGESYLLLL